MCEPEGVGAAVLIRALEPLAGIERMRARRGGGRAPGARRGPLLGAGQADAGARHRLDENGTSLSRGPVRIAPRAGCWREPAVSVGTRVGITHAVELRWRFCASGNRHVSRPRPS